MCSNLTLGGLVAESATKCLKMQTLGQKYTAISCQEECELPIPIEKIRKFNITQWLPSVTLVLRERQPSEVSDRAAPRLAMHKRTWGISRRCAESHATKKLFARMDQTVWTMIGISAHQSWKYARGTKPVLITTGRTWTGTTLHLRCSARKVPAAKTTIGTRGAQWHANSRTNLVCLPQHPLQLPRPPLRNLWRLHMIISVWCISQNVCTNNRRRQCASYRRINLRCLNL